MEVRVRFAPSPTGNPHVGNIRTALFDFLFARHHQGVFILRIEDTDQKRNAPESYQAIIDSLRWLGLTWDEGPVSQSERLEIYQKHAQLLIEKGNAYKSEGAIYFKTKKEGQTSWTDLINNKKIEFDNKTQEDFVVLKSDGRPTYHLASVTDDHLMKITHVTRGEDWISSTPKHLMLYEAFSWQPPQFAHFPNILATDRSKLSKRHGAIGILDFKKDGFLPEALINYLALLGWTPPVDKEILSLEEMITQFDLKDVNPSPAIFDIKKLEWLNGEYIRKMSNEELAKKLQEYLVDSPRYAGEAGHPAKGKIAPIVPLIKERIKKLSDFIPLTDFLFEKPEYEKDIFLKVVGKEREKDLTSFIEKVLKTMESLKKPWQAEEFEKEFRLLAEKLKLSTGQMFQLVRACISGQTVTPPLFESIKILGEDETLERVKWILNNL